MVLVIYCLPLELKNKKYEINHPISHFWVSTFDSNSQHSLMVTDEAVHRTLFDDAGFEFVLLAEA